MALDTAWPWANDTYVILQIGIAMGLLAANKNELAARGAGAVVLGAGAVSWLSARTGGGAGRVLAPLPVLSASKAHRCWCQLIARAVEVRKLAVQAACILGPASRMSTGRGILPSYLGLCWCHFLIFLSLQGPVSVFLTAIRKFFFRHPSTFDLSPPPDPKRIRSEHPRSRPWTTESSEPSACAS